MRISILFFLLSYTTVTFAQLAIEKPIVHKIAGFKKDNTKLWKDIAEHEKPEYEVYEPQLFLWTCVDTLDFRKDAYGYKYFKTNLFFGFKDQDEFYELPKPVYAGTGNKFRTHQLSWIDDCFYLLTNDLIDSSTRNVLLYKLDKQQKLWCNTLTKNPDVGNYACLSTYFYESKLNIEVSYFNAAFNELDKISVFNEFVKIDNTPDTTQTIRTNKDIEAAKQSPKANYYKNFDNIKSVAQHDYSLLSNPDYNHKQYLLSKNVILIQSAVSSQYEKQGVIPFKTSQYANSENDSWRTLTNENSFYVTSLFLKTKTDSTSFKTDSKGNKYFKTFICFGFANDEQAFQLPAFYYIREKQKNEEPFYSIIDKEKVAFKDPCLVFSNETYYLFVPNYTGGDKQAATMFTYNYNKGLAKEILWEGDVFSSASLPYFVQDSENKFALKHTDEKLFNITKTYISNNKWLTIAIDLNVPPSKLKHFFLDQSAILYLDQKPLPYIPPSINIKNKRWVAVGNYCVFMNTDKDKQRFKAIEALPYPPQGYNAPRKIRGNNYRYADATSTGIFYTPINHSEIIIPYMPAIKDQDPFGACESYADAALYGQAINSDKKLVALRKIDHNALKKETDISAFGMQQFVRGNKTIIDPTNLWMYSGRNQEIINYNLKNNPFEFDFRYRNGAIHYKPLEIITQNDNNLDAIPENVAVYYYNKLNARGSEKIFIAYLEELFASNKLNSKSNMFYETTIEELHNITGIPIKNIDLQSAYAKPNFQAFLYALFFNNCSQFISLSTISNIEVIYYKNKEEAKKEIVSILQLGRPLLIHINTQPDLSNEASNSHAIVICGYKKMIDPNTGLIVEAFKVQNSWGEALNYQTNEGWFLADNIIYSLTDGNELKYIPIAEIISKEWIESTDDYKRLISYKNIDKDRYIEKPVGNNTVSTNQKDIEPLYKLLSQKNFDINNALPMCKTFFKDLGYKLINVIDKSESKNKNKTVINFEGAVIKLYEKSFYIICPSEKDLDILKSKIDFSKINGEFTESNFNDGSYYLYYRQLVYLN